MVLKKPSEYFKKKEEVISVNESVQELVKVPEMNTFSDAFEAFKNNLSKIEVLSEFSETLDNYRVNIERVNYLSEKVEDIQIEIKNLLKKEDLDRAMLSQLLVVEQNILELQNKVKGINEKNLTKIRLDVSGLSETVNEFIDIEVPKYKKLIVDAEIRVNNRYEQLEENVNQTLQGIGEFVDKKYDELTENLQGINEKSLSGIVEDFKILDNRVLKLKEEEIPKYKGFIVETERKVEQKLNEFDEKINQNTFNVDTKIGEFNDKLDETVNTVLNKIDSVDIINSEKIEEVSNLQKRVNSELRNVEESKKELSEKLTTLEVEIIRNENHIKKQNNYIENIKEEVQEIISKLQIEKLEEKNYELIKKVKYLEEVFEKFNTETLTEGLLNEPPEVKNQDPLTPLDQKFVTLDQLQEHYRLFINRIQQQLSTFSGGGETRLKYLDDIVGIATNASAYDGKYLRYNHTLGKFQFSDVNSDDDSWVDNSYGTYTNTNVGIGTTNPTSKLYVNGDTFVSGVVTATTFYGDGSQLTGITFGVGVKKDNVLVGTGASIIDFVGAGVSTITVSSGIATVVIPAPQKSVVYYTSTEGQTTFTANYTVGYIDVYLNGVKLSQSQFTANDGISVVLNDGASAGDIVELLGYTTFNVSQSYSATAGIATYALVSGYASNSGFATNSQLADVATVANSVSPTINVNTSGVITATSFFGSGSNLSGIVTNITAGDNITISSSNGNVKIDASGGGGNWVSSGATKVYTTSLVGIGILNPVYNLDVFGNINFTGTIYQNGTPFSGSKWIGDGPSTVPIYRLSDVGVGITNPIARLGASSFTLGNVGHSTSGIVTTTTITTNQVLDSMPTATFRTARYQVSIACTGQLVGSASSSSTASISAITAGTFYIPGTYTNVPLTGGSGTDATATITVTGTSNNVGFTTTGNLLVTNTQPHNIGTNQPIILAANVPNSTLTGTALTAGTIYYATGIGTTAFTVAYSSGGATVAIGTTSFAGVGNTVTISGGVSIVSITSPGSGYGIGNTLSAAAANLGSVGSGFTCLIGTVVSNYQSSDLMILQSVGSASTTTCDYIEYASLANNDILGTFGADISGSNARLLFSPTYRNNTIKLVRHSIVV